MTAPRAILIFFSVATASAQFTPLFLQNASYWGDSKSEFDFYNAEFMRDGQMHQCELLMIFTPRFVDANSFVPVDDPKRPGALPAIQMQQFATLPRGLVTEQRSLAAFWRMDFMSLAHLSFVGTDGFGNIDKHLTEKREGESIAWKYSSQSNGGNLDQPEIASPKGIVVFRDELPLRVRMLDFSKTTGESEIQLAPTLASAEKELGRFQPAKLSWKIGERNIDVDLASNGRDHFVLDRDFPFLLREWQMADGSRLKMKNSIKVDYRNYLKNGDRERALKDPMLRHPD